MLALLPLLLAPSQTSAPVDDALDPTRVRAVIVGVLEWQHDLTPYPKRHRKDQELRDLLVSLGTPGENIAMLLDGEATLSSVRAALTRSAQGAPPGSTLIVYYAGHGMPSGASDFCFANYELEPGRPGETGWSLRELGETLAREFKGERVLLLADCCYSGGLELVVERLAAAGIEAANLTSASRSNSSTDNWTFTQTLIDGLSGEPLCDADGDGEITLGELAEEVREAMRHLEGQRSGFHARGVDEGFVLAKTRGPWPVAAGAPCEIGGYVLAPDGERRRPARVVGVRDGACLVQFYDYSDKRLSTLPSVELAPSPGELAAVPDEGLTADCEVEWHGEWWAGRVLERKEGRFRIHYLGYASSWDEWVGPERIRFPEPEPAAR